MAQITTQLEFKYHDEGYFWSGRDRLSLGIFVGNKDFAESFKEVKRQLKSAIQQNDLTGTATCTQTEEQLLEALKVSPRMMTLWIIDTFG